MKSICRCFSVPLGNILVIVIVVATKNFHSVTSVLIINLAISDLLVGVGIMPFVAISVMNNGWVDCTDLCLYVGYTSSVYCTASVLTLAAIALDRYYSIMDCLRYSSRCTLSRIFAVVLWIWFQALVTSCPPLLGWGAVSYVAPMYSCVVNWKSSPSYTVFMAALSFLVPAVVILFCYVHIVRVARSHARRIHTLEDHLQRNQGTSTSSTPSESTSERASPTCSGAYGSSTPRLVCHLSGRFVSEASEEARGRTPSQSDSTAGAAQSCGHPGSTSGSSAAARRLFSFLAQHVPHSHPHPPQQNSNSHQHHHHGVVRLFLVIFAFFLCWTPYMGVALIQATETALSCQSSLVPSSAVTFSYWLVLFNSDINPLLYALLSKRFQGALQCLKQKVRVRLGGNLLRRWGGESRWVGDGEEGRSSEPSSNRNSSHPHTHSGLVCPGSGSDAQNPPAGDGPRRAYCSSVFTVDSNFTNGPRDCLCDVLHPGSTSSTYTCSSSLWQNTVGGGGERSSRRLECLQVPTRTPEGSRPPFSAAGGDGRATFFYGQITVSVEHEVR
ncbi:alpha-2Db adrenergic receptor isoform X2 [Esox lucius]|uniref:alpha-2Db adrenergic receptor isoform X2 n=1 Tax=Esox lucius TaxID=8010 RepID=UPI001476A01F|nr:alpha-2Db adrenergic receptor isoform X2 [Esox lucius]